jgi:hypothetical protein
MVGQIGIPGGADSGIPGRGDPVDRRSMGDPVDRRAPQDPDPDEGEGAE